MGLIIFFLVFCFGASAQDGGTDALLLMDNVKTALQRTGLQDVLAISGPNAEGNAVMAYLKRPEKGLGELLTLFAVRHKWKKDKFISRRAHGDAFKSFRSNQRPSLQVVVYRTGRQEYFFKLDLDRNIPGWGHPKGSVKHLLFELIPNYFKNKSTSQQSIARLIQKTASMYMTPK